MSKLYQLYQKIDMHLAADPSSERQLHIELARIVSTGTTQSMGSDEGFCFKFNLPIIATSKLSSIIGTDVNEIYDAFAADWGSAAMTHNMYKDPYYQSLLIITLYGILKNKPQFSENALLIILFKLWNGRKTKYLKYCDKRIMRYVITHMCTQRHIFSKYDDPLSMLQGHFVPTLLKKYAPEIKKDIPKMLQRLFSQAWGRLDQQWATNMREDIQSGKKIAQGGILPLYMKAKDEGYGISTSSIGGFDEDGPSFDEHTTVSNRDEIIKNVCDFITMNPNPRYPTFIISQINKDTKVSQKVIEKLLNSLHNYNFYNRIYDVLSIILSSTDIKQKDDVCSASFPALVKKKVISSKNNEDARKLQKLMDGFLKEVFQKQLGINFNKYSNVQQIQLRTVVIQGIVYNLRKNQCRGSY